MILPPYLDELRRNNPTLSWQILARGTPGLDHTSVNDADVSTCIDRTELVAH